MKFMRKQIAAANWKMNLTYQQGEKLLDDILDAMIELEEAARALRQPEGGGLHWIKEWLKAKDPKYKRQALKTLAAINDADCAF